MSLIVEYSVEIPPMARASRAVPEMRFVGQDIVLEEDHARKFVFAAHGTRFGEFEAGLEADPTVAASTVLTKREDTAHYVVTYSETTDTRGTYAVAVEHDVVYLTVELQDGEYTVRARAPDRAALSAIREYCLEEGVPFELKRVYREDPSNGGSHSLTAAQEEALRLAYERGYYDSPRGTSLEEIGDVLGVSRQAVADRLRRGYKRLIGSTLG